VSAPRTLLIHGSIVNVDHWSRRADMQYSHFYGLRDYIDNNKADLAQWLTHKVDANVWGSAYLTEYLKQNHDVANGKYTDWIKQYIENERYGQVITSSIGGLILLKYMNRYGLPEHIRELVFLAADIPISLRITDKNVLERLKRGNLVMRNYFCPWDMSLAASLILNRKIRHGQVGWKQPGIVNKLFWCRPYPYNHNDYLDNQKFLENLVDGFNEKSIVESMTSPTYISL
jgi:hypothetical protein